MGGWFAPALHQRQNLMRQFTWSGCWLPLQTAPGTKPPWLGGTWLCHDLSSPPRTEQNRAASQAAFLGPHSRSSWRKGPAGDKDSQTLLETRQRWLKGELSGLQSPMALILNLTWTSRRSCLALGKSVQLPASGSSPLKWGQKRGYWEYETRQYTYITEQSPRKWGTPGAWCALFQLLCSYKSQWETEVALGRVDVGPWIPGPAKTSLPGPCLVPNEQIKPPKPLSNKETTPEMRSTSALSMVSLSLNLLIHIGRIICCSAKER